MAKDIFLACVGALGGLTVLVLMDLMIERDDSKRKPIPPLLTFLFLIGGASGAVWLGQWGG